jgi:hypothetical protein
MKLNKEQFLKMKNAAIVSGTKRSGRKAAFVDFLKNEIASGNKQIACDGKTDIHVYPFTSYEVKQALKSINGVLAGVGFNLDKILIEQRLGFVPCPENEVVGAYKKESAFVLDLS